MGLDYDLEMETDLSAAQVCSLLAFRFKLEWLGDAHLGGPATWIGIIESSPRHNELTEEAFGFRPDVLVGFAPKPHDDDEYAESRRFLIRATIFLLDHCRDAVLLVNGERIVLQRLGGKLVLNEDYGNWTDGYKLELEVPVPHEKRPLPSPFL